MNPRRIAILIPVALALSATPVSTALAANHAPAHPTVVSHSDSSRDVNEHGSNPDRSRADSGHADSSTDRSLDGHDAGDS
jgi:hypothetical protein